MAGMRRGVGAFLLSPRHESMEAKPNDRKTMKLGHYRIERQIGRGGMGKVFLAHDEHLDRQVAVKVLSSSLATNQKYVERFYREANSAGVLNHPNIVQAIDAGQEGEHHYFVMEYLEGETLRARLKRTGPLPEPEALAIAEAVAQALDHAAAHHIVHRDLKPENIMVNLEGHVKLMDLGLAKSIEDPNATVTQAGTMIGTPHYASPEQLQGLTDIDCRTDLYSLGITLYHLLVGRPPFEGDSPGVVSHQHIHEEVPSPRAARPELSENIARLVWRMTRKRPDDRYQSAGDLLADIRRILAGENIAVSAAQQLEGIARRRRGAGRQRPGKKGLPVVPIAVAAAALLLVAIGAYSALRKGSPPEDPGKAKLASAAGANQSAGPAARTSVPATLKPTEPEGPGTPTLVPVPVTVPDPPEHPADQPEEGTKSELTEDAKQQAEAFAQAQAAALDSLSKNDFRAAIAAIQKVAEALPKEEWSGKIDDVRIEIVRAAEKQLSAVLKDAQAASGEAHFDEAEKLLRQDQGRFPEELEPRLTAAIEELSTAKRAFEESRNALAQLKEEIGGQLSSRQYDAARKAIEAAREQVKAASLAPQVEELSRQISLTEKAWLQALEALREMKGRAYQVGGFTGEIQALEGATVRIESSGGTVSVPLDKLAVEQVIALAARKAQELDDGQILLGLAWTAFHSGQFQQLLPRLKKIDESPAYVALLEELDITTRGGREGYAKELWQEALAAARAHNWSGLQDRLRSFEKAFQKTEHLESRRELFEELKLAAGEGAKTNRVLRVEPEKSYLAVRGPLKLRGASYTLETWVRTEKRGSILLEQGGDHRCWVLFVDSEGIPCFIIRGGPRASAMLSGTFPVDDGRFHHLAAGFSLAEKKAFLVVDGEKVRERECGLFDEEPQEGLTFCGAGETSSVAAECRPYWFGGELDEVRVWNVARTVAELKRASYCRLQGNEEGLVGYWNFDESTRDLSANRNHLELKGKTELADSPWTHYLPSDLVTAIEPARTQDPHADLKAALAKLFRGKAEVRDDGSVELVYEFKDPQEGCDWPPAHGTFAVRDGQLKCLGVGSWGSTLWHRGRFVGDVHLEFLAGWQQGIGIVIKGNGRTGEEGRGLAIGIGNQRQANVSLGNLAREGRMCERSLGTALREENRIKVALDGEQVALSVNEQPVELRGSAGLWLEANSRVGLMTRGGTVSWREIRVTGQLDRRWVAAELASKRWDVPEGDYALQFGRDESHFRVPQLQGVSTGEFTWEARLRLDQKCSATLFYCGSWEQGTGLAVTDQGQLVLNGKLGENSIKLESPPDVVPWGEWAHLAVTHDGKLMRLFVNGKGVKGGKWPSKLTERDYSFVAAQSYGCGGRGSGRIDELRLSSDARYTRNFRPKAKLEADEKTLALFHFDEGEGTQLIDSAQGIIGSVTGGARWVNAETGEPVRELVLWEAWKRKEPNVFVGLEFKKREDYVSFQDRPSLNLRDSLTVEAWLSVRHFHRGAILEKGNEQLHSYSLGTGDEGQVYFNGSDRTRRYRVGTRRLEAGRLYHLAATFDKGMARIFVDGELHGEEQWPTRALQPSKGAPLLLARRLVHDYAPGYLLGRIYQVRISSAARYTRNFEPARKFEQDKATVLLLPMEEGRGYELRDAVSRGRKGLRGQIFGAEWIPEEWPAR